MIWCEWFRVECQVELAKGKAEDEELERFVLDSPIMQLWLNECFHMV
jgi:hypothetical protein